MPIDMTRAITYEERQPARVRQSAHRQRQPGEPPAWALIVGSVGALLLVLACVGVTVLLF
jgi:hypothetical protein